MQKVLTLQFSLLLYICSVLYNYNTDDPFRLLTLDNYLNYSQKRSINDPNTISSTCIIRRGFRPSSFLLFLKHARIEGNRSSYFWFQNFIYTSLFDVYSVQRYWMGSSEFSNSVSAPPLLQKIRNDTKQNRRPPPPSGSYVIVRWSLTQSL